MSLILSLGSAICQDSLPRPYISGGVALLPSGYASVGWLTGGGLDLNKYHLVFDSFAGYDNGRKVDDGGPPNPNGHDRLLRGFAGYNVSGSYIGAGARWTELSTTNYTKSGWQPEVGVGHDLWPDDAYDPNCARLQVAYVFKKQREIVRFPDAPSCYFCGNGSRGVAITIWFPSPANPKYHVFFSMDAMIFGYHNNPADRDLHITDTTEMTIGYRFFGSGFGLVPMKPLRGLNIIVTRAVAIFSHR